MMAAGRMELGRAVHFGRALKSGAPVLLELAVLFSAGGSAAAVGWALLEPVDASVGGRIEGDARLAPASLAARLASDPFRSQAPTASLASFGSAEGYALHATRVSVSGASAILTAPGLAQTSYAVGAPVGSDARLVSVAHDHVVLERAGQRIRVAFPPPAPSLLTPVANLAEVGALTSPSTPTSREAIASNATAAMDITAAMGFQTIERAGGRLGLAVANDAHSGLAAAAGLQVGDIVVALNGRDITRDGLAARQGELLSGAPLEISFERNGQVLKTRLGRSE